MRRAPERDGVHATLYSTNDETYTRPAPHISQTATIGSDPHATVTSNPFIETVDEYLARRLRGTD